LTRSTFTGQYSHVDDPTTSGVTEGFGLMFYNARYYDPALGRFAQADSLIPGGAQGLDRYAYVNNNPIRYTDPSGHRTTCDIDENCKQSQRLSSFTEVRFWKALIKDEFGINMKDGKVDWSLKNLQTAYQSLNMINDKLNGYLKRLIGGTTFTITDGGNKYYGATHLDGSGITFHVADSGVEIPNTNFFHETGHLLDLRPATKDVFFRQPSRRPQLGKRWLC